MPFTIESSVLKMLDIESKLVLIGDAVSYMTAAYIWPLNQFIESENREIYAVIRCTAGRYGN